MKKIGIILIISLILVIGLLSGCINNSGSKYNFDNANIVLEQITFEGFSGVYRGRIWVVIELEIDVYDNLRDCSLDELSYTLNGNGHYLTGGEIEYVDSGQNQRKDLRFGATLYDYLTIYDDDTSTYNAPMKPTVYIHPEIRTALENETTVEWSISGQIRLKTPNNDYITHTFQELTYYQSDFR